MIIRSLLVMLAMLAMSATTQAKKAMVMQPSAPATAPVEAKSGKGIIFMVNLENRIIQVNQLTFALGDQLLVTDAANNMVSQFILAKEQNIEYWLDYTTGKPMVTKIHVLTGFDPASLPKH